MQKVLDLSIRDYYKDEKNSGFQINQKVYNNYMSNHKWDLFVKQMQIDCPLGYNQYKKGSGKELEPKRYPPKMASYGSSSRFIYLLSKDIEHFEFEKQLPTHIRPYSTSPANIDGYYKTKESRTFVEAKCREIYGTSHSNEHISEVYYEVYKFLNKKSGTFKYERGKGFMINSIPILYFDLKQLICHFLGISYDFLANKYNEKIKFIYLIFNPTKIESYIKQSYREKIIQRYNFTVNEIIENKELIISLFKYILEFQSEKTKIPYSEPAFEFILADQDSYSSYFK